MRIIFSAVAVSIKLPTYKLNPFAIFFMLHDLILDKLSKLIIMTKSDVLGQRFALFNKKRN